MPFYLLLPLPPKHPVTATKSLSELCLRELCFSLSSSRFIYLSALCEKLFWIHGITAIMQNTHEWIKQWIGHMCKTLSYVKYCGNYKLSLKSKNKFKALHNWKRNDCKIITSVTKINYRMEETRSEQDFHQTQSKNKGAKILVYVLAPCRLLFICSLLINIHT